VKASFEKRRVQGTDSEEQVGDKDVDDAIASSSNTVVPCMYFHKMSWLRGQKKI